MTDLAQVRQRHSITDVLARLGHQPPARWNSGTEFTICCPLPDHDDSRPSFRVHVDTGHFHCFGCGAHGDIFDLARAVVGLHTLTEAITWINGTNGTPRVARPGVPASVPPGPSKERVLEINEAAWELLTQPAQTAIAYRYLRSRDIAIGTLVGRVDGAIAGYALAGDTGLTGELTRLGFAAQDLISTGWAVDRDGQASDRFNRRVLFPIRDDDAKVIGVCARDITGRARAKYLNTPTTTVYLKSETLYSPYPTGSAVGSTLVLCEGPIDALALAARGAVLIGRDSVPMAVCGSALTDSQVQLVASSAPARVLVMADNDGPGIAASHRWLDRLRAAGLPVAQHVLSVGHDPASAIAEALARQTSVGL